MGQIVHYVGRIGRSFPEDLHQTDVTTVLVILIENEMILKLILRPQTLFHILNALFVNNYFPHLNTTGLDYNVFNLNIRTSNINHDISSIYYGNFDIDNESLMSPLHETLHRKFAAELKSTDTFCPHIYNACSAGAYLKVFCSDSFTGQVEVIGHDLRKSQPDENIRCNLEAHVGYLLLCKVARLGENVLRAVRMPENDESLIAYAGGVILCNQFNYFADALLHKTLFDRITQPTRKVLGDWLASVVEELKDHMSEGCARYPNWSSVIEGSLKKLRLVENHLNVSVHLQQHKISPSQEAIYLSPAPTSNVGTNIDEHLIFEGNEWLTLGDCNWLGSIEAPQTPFNTPESISPEVISTNEIVYDEYFRAIVSQSQPLMYPCGLIEFENWNDARRLSRGNSSNGTLGEVNSLSPSLNLNGQYFQASHLELDFDNPLLQDQTLDGFKSHNSTPDPLSYGGNKLEDNVMIRSHASSEYQSFQPTFHDPIHTTPCCSPFQPQLTNSTQIKHPQHPQHPHATNNSNRATAFPVPSLNLDLEPNFMLGPPQARTHYTSL
ncbi:hypothetical protein EYC80_001393 [Monilinia laxa]|uniref:Uncharacterized protein n=1 Tax=Monilinia laxa TaxID=61186 RepID=A0A5N6K986_MONLA|nr:hypothetical protein EYC80_001393 [Monilinia laxa]